MNGIDNIKEKKTRIKPTKFAYHAEERTAFLNELNIILNINDDNNIIYMDELENPTLIEFININEEKIRKTFKTSSWSFYKKARYQTRQISSLIKNLYKHELYTIHSKQVSKKKDNGEKYTTIQLTLYKAGTIITPKTI